MRDRTKKRLKIISLIVLMIFPFILLLIAALFQGYELTVNVEKDAYVSEYYPDKNYGANEYLRVGNYYEEKIQTFYHFNISSIPDGWKEVKIVVKFDYSSSSVDIAVNLTYEPWDEMTINWNNKPNQSVYRGHCVCDGVDFRMGIPLRTDQIINDGVSICLYGRGGDEDGYVQGYSKEGTSKKYDIAWIQLSYEGIDPRILTGLSIFGIIIGVFLGTIGLIILTILIKYDSNKISKKHKKNIKKDIFGLGLLNVNLDRHYTSKRIPEIEKKINEYITLRLEHGRTFIYVNGRRFIQCIRLILNIPKDDITLYDEVDSIDEAANLYDKHIYQNRIVRGPMAAPLPNQSHDITPEQEFWGHCSNIQAWVEYDYDTRILMSNISFPLLRELTKAGDPKAKRVYKEEIALRLESGYPSVVQYLLTQGYIQIFSPEEFKTILETIDLVKKLSSNPKILAQFLRSCVSKFPTLVEDILLQILKLSNGKEILLLIIQKEYQIPPFLQYLRYNNPQFLVILRNGLENLLNRVDEKTSKDIIDYIQVVDKKLKGQTLSIPPHPRNRFLEAMENIIMNNLPLNELMEEPKLLIKEKILPQVRKSQSRCSYCGKVIPKDQDTCEWCGHKKDDDEGGFFPFPFIFKPPGGGGGGR
ncbi:MAG: DNRLRE domain-containing protein, partial [Candidatus Hermodarchaeota archaeon]